MCSMQKMLFKAGDRGFCHHHIYSSYLKVFHTFQFENYKNKERQLFGVLESFNAMIVGPANGFGLDKYNQNSWLNGANGLSKHYHSDIEIVTIPLSGEIELQDNKGYYGQVKAGEVHLTSAGGGIMHCEFNNTFEEIEVLELWIKPRQRFLPEKKAKRSFNKLRFTNGWDLFISPTGEQDSLEIYQDVWMSVSKLNSGEKLAYIIRDKSHLIFIFLISGGIQIGDEKLTKGDAIGIKDISEISLFAADDSHILIIELPEADHWNSFTNTYVDY